MNKFTIIVPAYNSAKTIKQCIDSVLKQMYSNFELIIINDGSTDDTLEIVKKINDSRIKIISQENSGPFIARKQGIMESKGDYILFLDSDDYIYPNALEILNNILIKKKYDLIKFNYEVNGKISNSMIDKVIEYEDDKTGLYNELIYGSKLNNLCNECVNKKILEGISIPDLKIMQGEDAYLNFDIFTESKTILFIPNVLYRYNINLNSTTNNINYERIIKSCYDVLFVYDHLLKKIEEWNLSTVRVKNDISTLFLLFISYQVVRILKNTDISKDTFEIFLNDFLLNSKYQLIVNDDSKINRKLLKNNRLINKIIVKNIYNKEVYKIYKHKVWLKYIKYVKHIIGVICK